MFKIFPAELESGKTSTFVPVVELLPPQGKTVKGLLLRDINDGNVEKFWYLYPCDIVSEDDSLGAIIIHAPNGSKPLLTRRVPVHIYDNLKQFLISFHCLTIAYQICSLTVLPFTTRVLTVKSTPMVVMVSWLNVSSTYLRISEVFPDVWRRTSNNSDRFCAQLVN